MIICSVNHVSKMFGGHPVFENLSFEIKEGERIGVVGRNGSGKTTIFKMISGKESPDTGEIHIKKGSKVGYLEQIPEFSNGATVYDVLALAFEELTRLHEEMKQIEQILGKADTKKINHLLEKYGELQDKFMNQGGYEIDSQIATVLEGLELSDLRHLPFSTLSGGEKTKVCLGLILLKKPDLLLLDEPTNHLDIFAVEWLEKYLIQYQGTVVIISHDRYFLDEVVTKVLDIEEGESQIYHGNYSYFVKEKEERLLSEFAAYQEQQKKIKKMKETIKRLKEWANQANPPNEGLHKRAKSMEKALERMEKIKRPILEHRKMGLHFDMDQRSSKDVVAVEEVTHGYEGKTLFQQLSFRLQFQERIAIVGQNGSGKSTLLKIVTNEMTPHTGIVRLGSQVKIGYLSQHVFLGETDRTVLETFRDAAFVSEDEARHILAKFLFYGHAVFRRVSDLSGGERMRLRLAQLMQQDINLLILDEPTNHLDIDSREVLEEAVEQFNGTIIAVSHDRFFLNKCFEITYWLANQRLTRYEGNYSFAREKHDANKEKIESTEKQNIPRTETLKVKKQTAQPLEQLRILETRIEHIETELEALNGKMVVESDYQRLVELQKEKDKKEREREELYWEMENQIAENDL